MTPTLLTASLISILGMGGLCIFWWLTTLNRRFSSLALAILLIPYGIFLFNEYHFLGATPTPRGGSGTRSDFVALAALYICMLLGMLSNYLFRRFEVPLRNRPKFRITTFIAPVFASPVVFIPLLAVMQNTDLDFRQLDAARFMIFLVSFENGFFWKDFFDNRKESLSRKR